MNNQPKSTLLSYSDLVVQKSIHFIVIPFLEDDDTLGQNSEITAIFKTTQIK